MSDFSFTFDQAYAYFAYRLPMEHIQKRDAVIVHCAFHADKNPSLSLNLRRGVWNCHGCNLQGGILDFERRMMGGDTDEAWKEIARITGITPPRRDRKLVATYNYTDVRGRVLYQKLRYEPKNFSQRQPDGKGGWIPNLEGVKKVLYRLPEVVTSKLVAICEGEKDSDNLKAILPAEWATTTTFDGAGKWKSEYAPYFTGRLVVIVPDNDKVGIQHAETIAASISPFAETVKVVRIPDLPEHGDVSDWLEAGHAVAEFVELVKAAPTWKPKELEHVLLVEAQEFLSAAPAEIEWLIEGMMPIGANGIIVADPKVGKSLAAIRLMLSLATASPFLGFSIPRRRRIALVSREDFHGETARRMQSLQSGEPALADYQYGQIWINTRQQSESFLLDNSADIERMIAELKTEHIDLAIFDVFRRLHLADENDNTAMAKVISSLTRIQAEVGCSIALVHHTTKERTSNVFRDIRGASAIHGWTEWGMGLTVADETVPRSQWIRQVEFELKCACPPDPLYFKIDGPNEAVRLELTEKPAKPRREAGSKLATLTSITAAGGGSWYEKKED